MEERRDLIGVRPREGGRNAGLIQQGEGVGGAHVEGLNGDETEVGPVTAGGDAGGAVDIARDHVATGADVTPDGHRVVRAVVPGFLGPLAAEGHDGGEAGKEGGRPAGVDLTGPDVGDPRAINVGQRGAAGPIGEIGRIDARGLADGPFVGFGAGPGGRPAGGERGGAAGGEAALQRIVIIDRARIRGGAVHGQVRILVFKLLGERAGIGEFVSGAVGIVDHGDGVGGRARRGNAGQAVADETGATVVDVRVVVGADKRGRAIPEFGVGIGVDAGEREGEARRDFPVGGEGRSFFHDGERTVFEGDLAHDLRPGIGGRGGVAVGVGHKALLGIGAGLARTGQKAEAVVKKRLGVIERVVGLRLRFLALAVAPSAASGEFLIVEVDAEVVGNSAAFALEGALRLHVDRAARSVGIGGGRAGEVHLDGINGIDGKTFETGGAGGVAATAVRIRAGGANTVERDTDVLGLHAAERGAAGLGLDVVDVDARQIFEEFADIAVGHVAKDVGGNGVADVHAAALFHDRLRVALALGVDGEGLHLHDAVFRGRRSAVRTDEVDLAHGGLAGGNGDGFLDGVVAGEGDRDVGRADGDVVQLKRAVGLGVGDLLAAFEADLGVGHIALGGGIVDAALHGARAKSLSVDKKRGDEPASDERGKSLPVQRRMERRCSHGSVGWAGRLRAGIGRSQSNVGWERRGENTRGRQTRRRKPRIHEVGVVAAPTASTLTTAASRRKKAPARRPALDVRGQVAQPSELAAQTEDPVRPVFLHLP